MIAKLFGWFWVVMGILWLIKPEMLRRKLNKKLGRKVRWTLWGVALALALQLTGFAFHSPGLLSGSALVLGLFFLVRAALQVTGKTQQRLTGWASKVPVNALRIWAAAALATGLFLLLS